MWSILIVAMLSSIRLVIRISVIILSVIMISVIILSVIMISVITLSVIMLDVIMVTVLASSSSSALKTSQILLQNKTFFTDFFYLKCYPGASIIKRFTVVIKSIPQEARAFVNDSSFYPNLIFTDNAWR